MASSDDDLLELGQYLQDRISPTTIEVNGRSLQKSFMGEAIVEVLISDGFAETSQQAVTLCDALLKKRVIRSMSNDPRFSEHLPYRFAADDDMIGSMMSSSMLAMHDSDKMTFEFPSGPLSLQLSNPPKGKNIEGGILLQGVNNPLLEGMIEKGDYIVEIAGVPVDGLRMKDVTKKIISLPRPLSITFVKAASLAPIPPSPAHSDGTDMASVSSQSSISQLPSTYTVVFREGSMGLRLESEKYKGYPITVVKGVTGQAEESGKIKNGDVIIRVNGVDVLGNPHKYVIDVLRSCAPPKTVEFVSAEGLELELNKLKQEDEKEETSEFTSGDVRALNIKKGILYKMGAVIKSWKSRAFHLRVECLEYFKDNTYVVPRGRLNLIKAQCSVRSIPGDPMVMISKKPKLWAKHLIEVRVNDRKLILAAASREDKESWIEAFQLAMDAASALTRAEAQDVGSAYEQALQMAQDRAQQQGALMPEEDASFCSDDDKTSVADQSDIGHADVASVISFDGRKFPRPRVHVTVISASNLRETGGFGKSGGGLFSGSINPYCEVSLGHESYRTSVVKDQRNPAWTEDNDCTLEAPSYDGGLLSIRLKSKNTLRGDELISTLTIDLNELPNMQKIIRKFPIVLGYSTIQQSTLTLALEYQNPKKEYEQSQKLKTMSNDTYEEVLDEERKKALEIKTTAEAALEEAQQQAEKLKQEAERLFEEARLKAGEELEKARAEIEAARSEAAARQAEVDVLREATKDVQKKTQVVLDQDVSSVLVPYKKMIAQHEPLDAVQTRMIEDGIPEITVQAFIEGHRAMEESFSRYQQQWAKEREEQKRREADAKKEAQAQMFSGLSADQTALLKRLAKLEKQLQNAGIQIAEDIPYEEAKSKVEEISKRMAEIGSADVTDPDPIKQKALREEYFKLEQDMEKYNNALMLTEEYQEEQRRIEMEWEEKHRAANEAALKAIRSMMPVDVKVMSEQALKTAGIPNAFAMRFKRTDVLQLLRMDPQNIVRWHPSTIESLRVTGLTLQERRALHCHLKDIVEKWHEQEKEELSGRKWGWFKGLKQTFKSQLLAEERGQRPKDRVIYDKDLGFPQGDVYYSVEVTKADVEDAGLKAKLEAQEQARQKRANARQAELKKHYKRDIRAVAAAEGALTEIESLMDRLEVAEIKWITDRSTGNSETQKEIANFVACLNDVKANLMSMSERSGMKLSGKRNAAMDDPDTRSPLEISVCGELLDWISEYTDVIQTLLQESGAKDTRVASAISSIEGLAHELRNKGIATLKSLGAKPMAPTRPLKPRAQRRHDIEEQAGAEEGASTRAPAAAAAGGRGRGDLMSAIKGGGRGGRGDGPPMDLMSAIKGRGRGGAPNDLMSAIKGRGRGGPGGDDLMSAIKGRGRGGPPGGDDLMAAIKGRGRGGGPPGGDLMSAIRGRGARGAGPGRGDLMSAIAARNKDAS